MSSFIDFGLIQSLLRTLKEQRIQKPTSIQSQVIPLMMSGQSVVGVSETGSGKTLTYALPILHALKILELEGRAVKDTAAPRAVIIVPTRELGEQVAKVFKLFTHATRLRVRMALGGVAFEQARRQVSDSFEILIATPGRLAQLLGQELIYLHDVRLLVFDEADQMLDQGFLPDSDAIMASCPEHVQLALFSATISKTVQDLINKLFSHAEVIKTSGTGKPVPTLITKNRIVKDGLRWPVLEKILKEPLKKDQSGTILFTNTREQCDKLVELLRSKGFNCTYYRGEMEANARRAHLKKFRSGEVDLLVSTDLAARGLDVPHVGRVINYHLPKQLENYIHRAGRTARAGKSGLVINLVTERDERLINQLEGQKNPKLESSHSEKTKSSAKLNQRKKPKTQKRK